MDCKSLFLLVLAAGSCCFSNASQVSLKRSLQAPSEDSNDQPVFEVNAPQPAAPNSAPTAEDDDDSDAANNASGEEGEAGRIKTELAENVKMQKELKNRIAHLSDELASNQEINESAALVSNQTESEALGDTLGHMWKEMRMFEVPRYTDHVEKQIIELQNDEKKLETELDVAQGKGSSTKGGLPQGLASGSAEELKHKELPASKATKGGAMAKSPSYNFWTRSRQQQQSVLAGSLVYLVTGVLIAVFFNKFRAKHFTVEESTDVLPSAGNFSFHIFGCFETPKLCALGFFCPFLAWANTLDRRGLLSFWKAFLAFFSLLLLHIYTEGVSSLLVIALGVYFRQKLRSSFEIEHRTTQTVAMDTALWLCCQPCAIIQEAREEAVVRKASEVV